MEHGQNADVVEMTASEWFAVGSGALALIVAVITAWATWAAPSQAERLAAELRKVSSESEFRARLKFDCLRRVAGLRSTSYTPEWFAALNEIFVVFNDSEPVLRALITFHRNVSSRGGTDSELLDLIKAMMSDLSLDRNLIDDHFLLNPFMR